MAITPNTPNPVREDAYKTELATKLGIDAQYIPSSPVWRNEEEIAAIAEMFSNMTAGSSSGGVLVVTDTDGTLDKTWQEIHDADYIVVKRNEDGILYYLALGLVANIEGMGYVVMVAKYDGEGITPYAYTAETANGYPVHSE